MSGGFFGNFTGANQAAAARNAANVEANYGQQAFGNLQNRYNQAIGWMQPWQTGGVNSLNMLQDALGLNGAAGNATATGAFQANPGYQWALGQGNNLITNNAAASGLLNSTNFANNLMGYGQGMADQQYQGWLSRLTNMANSGQQAAGQMGNWAMNEAGQGANILGGLGQALGGGIINAANAKSAGFNNIMGLGGYLGQQIGPSLFSSLSNYLSGNGGSNANGGASGGFQWGLY